jgi:hypothetical protein
MTYANANVKSRYIKNMVIKNGKELAQKSRAPDFGTNEFYKCYCGEKN